MQRYIFIIKQMFIYRFLMFKMREITQIQHFLIDFKHFNY